MHYTNRRYFTLLTVLILHVSAEMPTITVPGSRVLVNEGETAELVCDIHGVPPPRLTWHRDGIPVSSFRFTVISTPLPVEGAKYCDRRFRMSVCLFVCLSARISQQPYTVNCLLIVGCVAQW